MLERYKTAACSGEAISLSICYAGLERTSLSFCLGINDNEFIMNAFGSWSSKCRPTAKVCSMCKVVCFLIRPFVSILKRNCKLFKLQLKIV